MSPEFRVAQGTEGVEIQAVFYIKTEKNYPLHRDHAALTIIKSMLKIIKA